MSRIVVGVTGLNASGKSSICAWFSRLGFVRISLSDVIRAELKSRGVAETRASLSTTANELRCELGSDVLARRVIDSFRPGTHYVVDSVRHPAEVLALRRHSGGRFVMVYVDADPSTRFERILARNRVGDVSSMSSFLLFETSELAHAQSYGQQVGQVRRLADYVVVNSGAETALHTQLMTITSALDIGPDDPAILACAPTT